MVVVGLDPGSIALCSGHADTCSALAESCGKLLTHTLVSSPAAYLRIFPIQLNLERKGSFGPTGDVRPSDFAAPYWSLGLAIAPAESAQA